MYSGEASRGLMKLNHENHFSLQKPTSWTAYFGKWSDRKGN